MRPAAIVVGITLLVAGAPRATSEPWRPDVRKAIQYVDGREGDIAFAVIGPKGHLYAYRGDVVFPSASVVKAMFLVAYLRRAAHRHLKRDEKELLGPMIRRSDNAAASRIANELGPRPLYRLARRAGMRHFHYTRPWGNTSITARDQVRFFYYMDRYTPNRHEGYAHYLLSHVIKNQRWGIGRIAPHGWTMYFKGGWGSGSGWVDHQVAQLEKDGRRIAVAMLIHWSPSHEYGIQTLRGLARRLLEPLP